MWKPLRLNWIAFASSLLLFAAILYFLSRKQGLDAFVDVLRRTGAVSFCVAVLLMLVVQGISAYRVKIITAAEALHSTGYRSLVRIQLISQFIAYGAPISALSDLAKAAMIKLRFDLPLGQSIRIVLYERICGALGAIVIGLLTTIWQLATDTPRLLVDIQFAVWAVGLMVGATILVIGELNLTSRNSVLDRIARAVTGLAAILGHRTMGVKLLLISLLQLLGFSVIFLILAQGMHIPVSRPHVVLFMPFIFLISSLPIFYQGWGGREAVIMLTIGRIGDLSDAQSIALSVAFGIVVAVSSLPGALFWIMRPSMRKSVRLAESEGRA
jgi:Lysylphosphatidylglycerol synthase TM region